MITAVYIWIKKRRRILLRFCYHYYMKSIVCQRSGVFAGVRVVGVFARVCVCVRMIITDTKFLVTFELNVL